MQRRGPAHRECYGAEPPTPDPEFGRVSYTQYEALYVRKTGKKIWYLDMDKSFPIDEHEPEPAELEHLQSAYRNMLKVDTHLFHPLATREALEAGVLKLRDDLTQLRRAPNDGLGRGRAALRHRTPGDLVGARPGDNDGAIGKGRGVAGEDCATLRITGLDGGPMTNPKMPEEHYHNARIHELGGNFSAARKEYSDNPASNLEALDPWLSYMAMLKLAEGKAGAVEAMHYFGDKLKPPTISYQTALALLEDGEARVTKLKTLAEANPDFGPLPWLISQEFSEARKGDQTIADQRSEKEWLEKFRAANAAGKVREIFPG